MPQYEPVKYIVENIECRQGTDGEVWTTSFQGKKTTLTEKIKPTWDRGDELPFKPKLIKPPDAKWYYERPEGTGFTPKPQATRPTQSPKSYTADPQKIESIEYQNARNLAVEMYGKVTEDGVPPDYELLDTIFRHINALGKDMVTVAKEQYGAVEK